MHPRVGAVDVAPIIYLSEADRGAAAAEALVLADLLGTELELPVFLYGILAGGRTRAELRRGGPGGAAAPDRRGRAAGPTSARPRLHPTAGAVLVAARPPLVAFNVELAPPATLEQAKADRRRTSARQATRASPGSGPSACGWPQPRLAQVSTNVEDHRATPLRAVVEAVARHAPVQGAELVGLAPEAAFDQFPRDIPLRGYATIEETLHRHAHSA